MMTSLAATQENKARQSILINWRTLAPWAFGYVVLPMVIFSLFWLRPLVGIFVAAVIVVAGILAVNPPVLNRVVWLGSEAQWRKVKLPSPFSGTREGDDDLHLNRKMLLVLAVVAVVWCFLGGQGSMWAQSADWTARNTIFQELIQQPWPIYYDNGSAALVYYINHWMVPAALARMVLLGTGSAAFAIGIGNVLLLAWTSIGVFLVELCVLVLLKAFTTKAMVFALVLLILFSGMDIVGIVLRMLHGSPEAAMFSSDPAGGMIYLHLEWWARPGTYQFSSNTTLLFWVFNQTVIPWLCTCMLLLSRSLASSALIVVACLAAGPYAGVGLAVIALVLAIAALAQKPSGGFRAWVRSFASPVNVIALLPAVVYASYFLCNQSVATSESRLTMIGLLPDVGIGAFALFLVLEMGIYAAIVGIAYWRTPLFWAVVGTLLCVPFIHIGSAYEFCCRASIPALFCLMLMCGAFLMKHLTDRTHASPRSPSRIAAWALVVCLAVGSVTPLCEFARGITEVMNKGIEASVRPTVDLGEFEVDANQASNFKAVVNQDALYFRLFAG